MTTEALRTQPDALRTDLHALEAQNRWLKEDRPRQAAALAAEMELARTQEENVRLERELGQLRTLYEQLLQVLHHPGFDGRVLAGGNGRIVKREDRVCDSLRPV